MGCNTNCCIRDEREDEILLDTISRVSHRNYKKESTDVNIIPTNLEDNINNLSSQQLSHKQLLFAFIKDKLSDTTLSDNDIFPKNYYRIDELNTINKFSKKIIVGLLESSFVNDNFQEIFNNENLILSIKSDGSLISNNFPILRMSYKFNKNLFVKNVDLYTIIKFINEPSIRMKWDKTTKKLIYQEKNGDFSVVYSINEIPLFFISLRETLDKKYEFFYKEKYYSFCSSMNDDYIKKNDEIVRNLNLLNIFNLWEDNNFFYIRTLSQVDYKIFVPGTNYNMTLPSNLLKLYNNLINAINYEG